MPLLNYGKITKNLTVSDLIYCINKLIEIYPMGLLFSKIWRRMFNTNREFKLIIVGLANAGKTTILYRL